MLTSLFGYHIKICLPVISVEGHTHHYFFSFKVLTNDSPSLNNSDVIFPVFGSQFSTQLYGLWFIPFMQVQRYLSFEREIIPYL